MLANLRSSAKTNKLLNTQGSSKLAKLSLREPASNQSNHYSTYLQPLIRVVACKGRGIWILLNLRHLEIVIGNYKVLKHKKVAQQPEILSLC